MGEGFIFAIYSGDCFDNTLIDQDNDARNIEQKVAKLKKDTHKSN